MSFFSPEAEGRSERSGTGSSNECRCYSDQSSKHNSIRETIEECWLIPALSVGVPEDIFWNKNPVTIMPYFKAYELKEKRRADEIDGIAWKIGAYVCNAIQSNVFVAGLADKEVIKNMPKYPKEPYSVTEERNKNIKPLSQEQKILVEKFRAASIKYKRGK